MSEPTDIPIRFRQKFHQDTSRAIVATRSYKEFLEREGPFELIPSTLVHFNIQQRVFGRDKQGHPVVYINAGEVDLSSLWDGAKQKLLVQHCVTMWEHMLSLAPTHTAVLNMSSLSWGCVQPNTLAMLSKLLAIYDEHYPDISKQILVINAPWFMPSIWPVIQGLIHASLRNRIHFLSSPGNLHDFIDASQLLDLNDIQS